ncbi:hypothetical protein B0H63DRAFT_414270 [Podospora didyma]|uniref:Glucose-methanol-choline oxidoreductase N-terminal domain-containing protein n=1 Tax=Podospora didyma TaxID=330526 RepID=A0AAE0NP94_9PEZI|nr:hypothetical protein B0H63DRAFT_414270 [Podospora didyma]
MLIPKTYLLALVLSCSFTLTTCTKRKRLPSSAYAIPGFNATYDYLVVGGGTTGLALASRLAESASVAIIEAGGFYELDNGNQSIVPYYSLLIPFLGVAPDYPRHPLMDWDRTSTPLSGADGRTIHYAMSKTLGGSSSHNTMAYLRSTKGSFQRWAEVVGDNSYMWDSFLPYYKKSCQLTPPDWKKRDTPNATFTYDASAFSSRGGGPIRVSWANWVDPTTTWLAKALQALGMKLSTEGFNSGTLSGIGAWSNTLISPKYAERSSATEYLKKAIEETEIMVYHHTQALKVNFNAQKKATSVRVSTQGLEYVLSARLEIIISAGAIHSPQLLMVSGIGPKNTLQNQNIPVLSDLPGVGQNLQDKLFFTVSSGITTPNVISIVNNPANSASLLHQYLDDQSGPLSSAGGYLSFEKLPAAFRTNFSARTRAALATLPADWPEIEYIVTGFPSSQSRIPTVGALSPTILFPFSRGNVTISSPNMADPPVFNLGWLTDPIDTELALAAFKRIRVGWNSSAIAPIKTGPEVSPGPGVTSDADILAYIRKTCNQVWHVSSTCAMGKSLANNPMAVVDSKARVFGVTGLRVLDASVFPFALPSHPTATLYALAEKIAEDIISSSGKTWVGR